MNRPSKLSRPASLLSRIVESPALAHEVSRLPAPALLRLVQKIGLEDSASLLALASSAQLTRMLDEDLWRQKASSGGEELDASRLSVWLQALSELGPAAAAEKLAALDEEFLCFALSRFLHALEREALDFMLIDVPFDRWRDDRLEKLLEVAESQEIGGVLVLAKSGAPWEVLQPLLLALDDHDQRLTASLLHRLCAVTEAKAEAEGGLFEVLSGEEMLGNDSAFSRESRRGKDGYLSAADAKAFRAWLGGKSAEELVALKGPDPVSRAYFRQYEGKALAAAAEGPAVRSELLALLAEEEGVKEEAPLLEQGEGSALARLVERLDPERGARFHAELNFLAQALALTEREARGDAPLRPADAAKLVVEAVERGIGKAGPVAASLSAIQLYGLGEKPAK